MDILKDLNPSQGLAVQEINGPVLIIAGPGSGKTRVIAHRIAYLVKTCHISPHRIMAVTFTNKAAREMKERVHQLLGKAVEDCTMGTFHALCARILRQDGHNMGIERHFVIFDEEDQFKLIKDSLQELSLDPKKYVPRAIQSAISAAKSYLLGPQEYALKSSSYFEEVTARVYENYQKLLAQSNALDFDDLLMKTVNLFRDKPEVLAKYQMRYIHVMIDEFQDTNLAQYLLAKSVAGKYRNLFVVGDPDQSIYSWRNADLRHILNFDKDYPEAKVLFLEQNYRSTQSILKAASKLISFNHRRKPKNLWTENDEGRAITSIEAYNEGEEAQLVAREIANLQKDSLFSFKDCAVMYRINAQSRPLEESLLRYGLPYRLIGGLRFYHRREVKDVIAYLRLIRNPEDAVSLSRVINVPPRGIGQKTTEDLMRWASSLELSPFTALERLVKEGKDKLPSFFNSRTTGALSHFYELIQKMRARAQELRLEEFLDFILEETKYRDYILEDISGEERLENVLELRSVAQAYGQYAPGEGLALFLDEVSLTTDVDKLEEGKADAITLITLHQSKGLEFPVVFIVGLEEGVLPHIKSLDDPEETEEERRLFYVGMTRAEKRLYLFRAFRRSLMGRSTTNPPSRFLREIRDKVTIHREEAEVAPAGLGASLSQSAAKETPTTSPPSRLPALKAGMLVRHTFFGEGTVLSLSRKRQDQEVTIEFGGNVGIKIFLLSLAPLEIVDGKQ